MHHTNILVIQLCLSQSSTLWGPWYPSRWVPNLTGGERHEAKRTFAGDVVEYLWIWFFTELLSLQVSVCFSVSTLVAPGLFLLYSWCPKLKLTKIGPQACSSDAWLSPRFEWFLWFLYSNTELDSANGDWTQDQSLVPIALSPVKLLSDPGKQEPVWRIRTGLSA